MDSDGDRMDSSVLPSSCCTEVVWDQAHHVFSIQSSSLLGPFTRFVGASFFILGAFPLHEPQKSKWQPAKFLEARMGCAWHWRKKLFVGDQLCFEVFHTCLSQRSLLERRWLCVDGWADGAG